MIFQELAFNLNDSSGGGVGNSISRLLGRSDAFSVDLLKMDVVGSILHPT